MDIKLIAKTIGISKVKTLEIQKELGGLRGEELFLTILDKYGDEIKRELELTTIEEAGKILKKHPNYIMKLARDKGLGYRSVFRSNRPLLFTDEELGKFFNNAVDKSKNGVEYTNYTKCRRKDGVYAQLNEVELYDIIHMKNGSPTIKGFATLEEVKKYKVEIIK